MGNTLDDYFEKVNRQTLDSNTPSKDKEEEEVSSNKKKPKQKHLRLNAKCFVVIALFFLLFLFALNGRYNFYNHTVFDKWMRRYYYLENGKYRSIPMPTIFNNDR